MSSEHRRRFLQFLAASPLAIGAEESVIAKPADALNVFDFEPAARKALPPAHYGYMATGVDDDATLKANVEGYKRWYLRPRRLVNIEKTDMRVDLFGTTWDMPIGLAPIGNQMAFHPQGERPVMRAAKAQRALAILSTATNTTIEDAAKELGRAPWYQLYTTSRWDYTERLVKRVQDAGAPVIAVTIDTQAGRRIETFERLKLLDKRECVTCHGTTREDFYRRKPMFQGFDFNGLITTSKSFDWEQFDKLRKLVRCKLLVKGIETAEDTRLCREHGADGVIVSNHGGRAEESGRGTIDCLPEVADAAGRGYPVFLDGGIRRGTDVFKALALGAKAVFVGRPYIWGLSAFGQPGVERVIEMLRTEFELVMKQCGANSLAEIGPSFIGKHG
jgi:isopentenyl diphosphate isomerase/L-lactate dehydrogenase-like FMN-dependent dehydrogenase